MHNSQQWATVNGNPYYDSQMFRVALRQTTRTIQRINPESQFILLIFILEPSIKTSLDIRSLHEIRMHIDQVSQIFLVLRPSQSGCVEQQFWGYYWISLDFLEDLIWLETRLNVIWHFLFIFLANDPGVWVQGLQII